MIPNKLNPFSSSDFAPVSYNPEFEKKEAGEEEVTADLVEVLNGINETTSRNYNHAVRASFAKSFALLEAELEVLPDLLSELSQGIFSSGKTYPAIMRFSTAPGDVLPDDISTARGLAIKIMDVEGDRLPGSEKDRVQDFIFVNAGFFFNATLKGLLGSLSMFAATTDKVEGLKKVVSMASQGLETAIEAMGMESSLVKHAGGQLPVHPLGDRYNTQAPMLYGPYMAKFRVVPASAATIALAGKQIDLSSERPNALREESIAFFHEAEAEWEMQVQLCIDIEKMPIEDPSVEWPEETSPFIPVARIKAQKQIAWSEEKSGRIDDCMSFNPWHGVEAHKPIGAIMRARRMAYPVSAEFRAKFNKCPFHKAP